MRADEGAADGGFVIAEPDAFVWEEDGGWLGYLRKHPDYWTQGEDLDDLREHLRDLDREITAGHVLAKA